VEGNVRGISVAAVVAIAVAFGPGAQPASSQSTSGARNSVERAFVQGGQVFMDLSAGGYLIEGTDDSKIRITWKTRDPNDMDDVDVSVGVEGKAARIDTDGPGDNFHVTIQLPKRADLTIRLSAGEISIRGIEGSKDVSAWAGELKIGVGRAADYRSADASVTAGEIDASAFNAKKEGLFRSFTKQGSGKYDLRVRLTAGKVVLSEESAAAKTEQARPQHP
jgi:hypothetical protein